MVAKRQKEQSSKKSNARGIYSMTGFGRAIRKSAVGDVSVEVRSTNHRYLEIDFRLPNGFTALQGRLTEMIRGAVQRGRLEVYLGIRTSRLDTRKVVLDENLLQRYHQSLLELKGRFGLPGKVSLDHLLALPQAVTVTEERTPPDKLWDPIRQAAQAAVQELVISRRREGARLVADLNRQLKSIEQHVRAVKKHLPKSLKQQRRRLQQRLQDLVKQKVPGASSQLAQQAAALAKDTDINEELVRLESHVTFMRQSLKSQRLIGKRLDFIAQELMRETNTMGAKVDDARATQHVVEMKGCIEKIREQVQNLE